MNGVISWNPVVIGVIGVLPASFFKGDWCYSSRSRENDLLQNQVKLSGNRDFSPKMCFKKSKFSSDWCYSGRFRGNDHYNTNHPKFFGFLQGLADPKIFKP